jgi:hypothetical protein
MKLLMILVKLITLPLCLVWHDDEHIGGGSHVGDCLRWEYYKCKRCGRKATKTVHY